MAHARHPASELASQLLVATALAEKAAALAPERRGEAERLIACLEEAGALAQRLGEPSIVQERRQLEVA